MIRSFKFRGYCNKATHQNALNWLELCRNLYNTALEQRIMAYSSVSRRSLSAIGQQYDLKGLKVDFPEYKQVGSQVLKDVIRRLGKTYDNFFRRAKQGHVAPGFPKFKGQKYYRSFVFPNSSGWTFDGKYLDIKHLGRFKLRGGRPITGTIKTVTVRLANTDKWFVVFSCDDVPPVTLPQSNRSVGIDVGTMLFSMDSDGKRVPRGEFLEGELKQLARLQRKAARQKEAARKERRNGSKRLEQTYGEIRRLHERIANRRLDAICKLSNYYAQNYGTVRIENLDIPQIVRKSVKYKDGNGKIRKRPPIARLRILDAAWGLFFQRLETKFDSALNRTLERVPTAYTTMTCSRCGHVQSVPLVLRMFDCNECGLRIHRKLNAARNINSEKTSWDDPGELSGIARLLEAVRHDLYAKGVEKNGRDDTVEGVGNGRDAADGQEPICDVGGNDRRTGSMPLSHC